ncbi:hypothetical protein KHS38_13355 [Mucilaginibacter sp. Bleaf8]|uniref:hypothetical protein n=1 Tax=Mucilaginibacter sp. Bleaf8 TaxID=2834430 RepID=UPI001BCDC2FC|nr:hypothetical protein [Mucilaginibacter sp. Bleaf8]MBS7565393.1 hypothetical protein [Mucilaginibacter sp. Bleaf8]
MGELNAIENLNHFRDSFLAVFDSLKKANPLFNQFVLNATEFKQAYVVGGFLRDIANNTQPRDLDILLGLPDEEIQSLINNLSLKYYKNRFNGYKIVFENFDLDCWSFDSNWAFKKRLLKSNSPSIENIANGTFLNFDSLVLNVHTLKINVKNYNKCILERKLDVVRRNSRYVMYNPTKEANILRFLYLSKKYDLSLSLQLKLYILNHINTFEILYGNPEQRLLAFKAKYPKYASVFSDKDYNSMIDDIKEELNHYSKEKGAILGRQIF